MIPIENLGREGAVDDVNPEARLADLQQYVDENQWAGNPWMLIRAVELALQNELDTKVTNERRRRLGTIYRAALRLQSRVWTVFMTRQRLQAQLAMDNKSSENASSALESFCDAVEAMLLAQVRGEIVLAPFLSPFFAHVQKKLIAQIERYVTYLHLLVRIQDISKDTPFPNEEGRYVLSKTSATLNTLQTLGIHENALVDCRSAIRSALEVEKSIQYQLAIVKAEVIIARLEAGERGDIIDVQANLAMARDLGQLDEVWQARLANAQQRCEALGPVLEYTMRKSL